MNEENDLKTEQKGILMSRNVGWNLEVIRKDFWAVACHHLLLLKRVCDYHTKKQIA